MVGVIRMMIYERSTYKRTMFCHTCFASRNTWLAGSAVGLRTECTHLHNKREGRLQVLLLINSIVAYRVVCQVWFNNCVIVYSDKTRVQERGADSRWCTTVGRARHDDA